MVEEKQDGPEPDQHPSPDELSLGSLADRLATASSGEARLGKSVQSDVSQEDFPDYEQIEIPAGHMVVGSRVPAPKFAGSGLKQAPEGQTVFSSSANPRKHSVARRSFFVVACIFATGLAAFSLGLGESDDPGDPPAGIAVRGAPDNQETQTSLLRDEEEPSPPLADGNATRPVVSVSPSRLKSEIETLSKPETQLAQSERTTLTAQDVSGDPDTDIPLRVSVNQQDSRDYAFIMFRGLPPEFALSSGFRLKQSWAVSLKDLQDLKLQPPRGYTGEIELEVMLVQDRNTPVENRNITVRIGPKPVPDNPVTTGARPPDQQPSGAISGGPSQSLATELSISADQESAMLERASQILKNGDVVSARLLLEHIARKGSSKGAFALAKTYDPIAFDALNALGGVQADLEKARKWYSVALQLGEEKARERLTGLAE